MTTLIIGLGLKIVSGIPNDSGTLRVDMKPHDGKCLRWCRFLKSKFDIKYDYILIGDCELIENQDTVLKKIVNLLKPSGKLYVSYPIDLVDFSVIREKIIIDNEEWNFCCYFREIYKPTKIIKRSYTKIQLSFTEKLVPNVDQKITIEQFQKIIDDDSFIEKYYQSLLNLLIYKERKYQEELVVLQKLHNQEKKIVQEMGKVSPEIIRTEFPSYYSLPVEIMRLKSILSVIGKEIDRLNVDDVRNNLLKIFDFEKGLNSIVGREEIKLMFVQQLYIFSKSFRLFSKHMNHIVLLGPSGAGKTAIAKVLAYCYSVSGLLITDNVYIKTRKDLVAQYIGQTAALTRSEMRRSLEGVCFIDEAYQLANPNSNKDFGEEAITEIVNFLDKYIGLNIVIVAGYEKPMRQNFFSINEGLERRFPNLFVLNNYSNEELADILLRFVEDETETKVSDNISNMLYSFICEISENFPDILEKQAGEMLNLSGKISECILIGGNMINVLENYLRRKGHQLSVEQLPEEAS